MFLSILLKKAKPEYNVVILEKNDVLGRKLLATGNGRCNYTNNTIEKHNFHSANTNKAWDIIKEFNNKDVINYFKKLGIYPKIESDGRVFPFSLEGYSVVELLNINMKKLGVTIINNIEVTSLKYVDEMIEIRTKNHRFLADKCVIATGGLALPNSGSDGRGYKFAKNLGHNIIDQTPAIVQLESNYKYLKHISGVRINTSANLIIDGSIRSKSSGDVLFTDYGISGPAILDLSREAVKSLEEFSKVEISINLLGINKNSANELLKERSNLLKGWTKDEFLLGIINSKLIEPVINLLDSEIGVEWLEDADKYINELSYLLTNLVIQVTGYKGYKNAQTTTGGVDLSDLTMNLESKSHPNMYFIGEVVDVDGDCGGYNLQWAWSSGYAVYQDIISK